MSAPLLHLGFRAGNDLTLGVKADDFAGTRKAWNLPDGTAPIGRVFPAAPTITGAATFDGLVKRVEQACKPVVNAGMWPYLSLKPDVNDALEGRLDKQLAQLARWAVELDRPVYMSFWHEPENDTMGANATDYVGRATRFVQMHTRCYQVMHDAAGTSPLRIGPCYMVYHWRPGSPVTADGKVARAWRVSDDMADFVAADAYTANWSWTSIGDTLRTKIDFQRWRTALQVPNRKILLTERGISRTRDGRGEAGQAAVLADDIAYLVELEAHGMSYWNSGGATDDSVFLLGQAARQVLVDAAVAVTSPTESANMHGTYRDGYRLGYAAGYTAGTRGGQPPTA
jgi:hypothetical protein